jgi:hypothetical protein
MDYDEIHVQNEYEYERDGITYVKVSCSCGGSFVYEK